MSLSRKEFILLRLSVTPPYGLVTPDLRGRVREPPVRDPGRVRRALRVPHPDRRGRGTGRTRGGGGRALLIVGGDGEGVAPPRGSSRKGVAGGRGRGVRAAARMLLLLVLLLCSGDLPESLSLAGAEGGG